MLGLLQISKMCHHTIRMLNQKIYNNTIVCLNPFETLSINGNVISVVPDFSTSSTLDLVIPLVHYS